MLSLTADEVILLCERVKTTDAGTEDQRVIPCRLLERLGSVYLELVTDTAKLPGTVDVVVTEPEAWLCLDRVSSFDATGGDPLLGVRLKRKLFALLLEFNSPTVPLPTVEDGADQRRVTERLASWQRYASHGPWMGGP